jgi:hypothetical protein
MASAIEVYLTAIKTRIAQRSLQTIVAAGFSLRLKLLERRINSCLNTRNLKVAATPLLNSRLKILN